MTIISEPEVVVETKLDEEFYVDEDGAEPVTATSEVVDLDGEEKISSALKSGHTVPKGVAVEELKNYKGFKKLREECPPAVQELLNSKDGLFEVYEKFVDTIASEKNTRGPLGKWRDAQFVSVLDQFQDSFIAQGVKVALCKRRSGKGTYRWLEFIDVEALEEPYVPQFDVANMSGQIIKTVYCKLKFPNGVAVEELKQWSGRKKLKEKVPIYVEKMLQKKDLMTEYNQLVDHVIESGVSSNFKNWKIGKLQLILDEYKPMFAAKGIDVFVSHKQEYVSHGQYGGHTEFFRWIEYVDRELQPNYMPQRSAEEKDEKCSIM